MNNNVDRSKFILNITILFGYDLLNEKNDDDERMYLRCGPF